MVPLVVEIYHEPLLEPKQTIRIKLSKRKMIAQLLIIATGGLLVAISGLVIFRLIQCQRVLAEFKRQSRGLPIYRAEMSLLCNQAVSVPLKEDACNYLLQQHMGWDGQQQQQQQQNMSDSAGAGQIKHKTLGWLYGSRFAAFTCDLDLIQTIVQDESHLHVNRMKANLPMSEFENSLMLAEDDDWRKLRRAFAPALRNNKFKTHNVLQEIDESIAKLIDHIERRLDNDSTQSGTAQMEADDFVHKYSLQLVFSCFYKQYDLIDFDDPQCQWTKLVDEGLEASQTNPIMKLAFSLPKLNPLLDWLMWHFHSQGQWRQKINSFVRAQTKLGFEARQHLKELMSGSRGSRGGELNTERFTLKDGTQFRRNMIDHVIDQFLDGKLTSREYFDTSCFLVSAADKTASDSIVHTLYLLALHQEVQEKLRESIKLHGPDSEYLGWVINESLRLLPPAPIGCSRTVKRPFEIQDGYVIPANTLVITCAYVIHRLKEYWGEDADEFRPERWQDTSHHHPMQYIPFGAGPRACPGREFAMFHMRMLFAALLSRYKFEGQHKEDAYKFNSPMMIFVIPNSPTYLTVRRLDT